MKDFLTPGFYKFLLGFSVIILVSFGVLFLLGEQAMLIEDNATDPESQLAQ